MPEENVGLGKAILGTIVGVVVAIALVFGVVAAVFGIRVATAGLVGRGQAHIQIESGTNRIEKQQLFEQLWADIRRFDEQIPVAAQDTSNPHAAENLNGLKLQCISAVEQYNAESRFVSAEQFKAVDLPASISAKAHCGG